MFLFLHQYLRYQVVENVVLDDFRIYFTINLELTFFFVCLVCCFFCVFKRFFYEVICNSLVEKPHWKYPFSKNRSVKPILFVLDIMEISEHILTDWLIRCFHRSCGIRPCFAAPLGSRDPCKSLGESQKEKQAGWELSLEILGKSTF